MPTALVTGAAGFAGSHLVEYLCSRGDLEVTAQVRPGRGWPTAPSRPARVLEADLLDPPAVRRIVEHARPEYVFHLAGFASPSGSLRDPEAAFTGNVSTQLHLLNAVREWRPLARVLVVGSGDEYGLVYPHELPIGEEQPFRPTSPYAVSKIAQEMLGYQAFIAYGLPVIRVRPFNHIGPRQSADFVTGAFARQIALVEAGAQEPVISVGNLDAKRDFTDVRDVVRAYWLAISAGTPGDVYNIGSGHSVRIGDILSDLLRLSRVKIEIRPDSARMRPADTPDIVCDAGKLQALTNWQPEIELTQTLTIVLEYWRERVAAELRAGE